MRVLHLFCGWKKRARRLQFDFVVKLKPLCEEFIVYGKGEKNKEYSPLGFDNKLTMSDLESKFKPDVTLLHMWEMYYGGRSGWLPDGFENSKVPKIMLEVDYWSSPKNNWYEDIGIDLLIQRGFFKDREKIPGVWLPFSANENEFWPDNNIDKKDIVLFVGGLNKKNPFYSTRRKAVDLLGESGLLAKKNRISPKQYPEEIRKFKCALSCGAGEMMSPVGKTFEYMASGLGTLCSPMHNQEVLFQNKECFFEYDIDALNVKKVAKTALNDNDKYNEITKNAIEITHKYHMDKHRIVELYDILKAFLEGKKIPKKWGN